MPKQTNSTDNAQGAGEEPPRATQTPVDLNVTILDTPRTGEWITLWQRLLAPPSEKQEAK